MLEAKLAQASVLKKLLEAIKELVTDANFECNEEGLVRLIPSTLPPFNAHQKTRLSLTPKR